ncbi:hypothetical protein E2562_003389 [Oryza meyeriana var. granulata]|uniref:Uncharacterized protein n=1 Tax=Oryza meyeriana var. granulata TaxID=110450 RepID=A0A6G1EEG6_9ORYZ|nr:hypothetical protein E2562_003389 [Oryza meyeriana var. granulata]
MEVSASSPAAAEDAKATAMASDDPERGGDATEAARLGGSPPRSDGEIGRLATIGPRERAAEGLLVAEKLLAAAAQLGRLRGKGRGGPGELFMASR